MSASWRSRLHEIIFEADTREGRSFDIVMIWMIIASVMLVILDSVVSINRSFGEELFILEWFFTILFTIDYVLRLIVVRTPLRYAFSFYGVIDLLSILPSYLSFFFPGAQVLLAVRVFRLLRIFRIFKLGVYLGEGELLLTALRASRHKIIVFLSVVLASVVTMGTVMYVVEGPENGFTNIPVSIYWSIVTMTTVGYGDIAPRTPFGQVLASMLMIAGYGIIAIPTGIVTTEIARAARPLHSRQACPNCGLQGHDMNARFCKFCGSQL